MPIFAYLAIPREGQMKKLHHELQRFSQCQVIPAENREVFILVTETADMAEEETLQNSLRNLDCLQSLSMTFGHENTPPTDTSER